MSSDPTNNESANSGNGHFDRSEPAKDTGRSDAPSPGKEELLVGRTDMKLPPLRSDIEMIPVTHEGTEMIYFHDPQGYLPGPIALDRQIAALVPMLNGQFSIQDICNDLKRYGSEVQEEQLLAFVRQLDESRLLLSPWFSHCKAEIEENFEREDVRPAVCAGSSYPSTEKEIREMLDAAFASNGESSGSAQGEGSSPSPRKGDVMRETSGGIKKTTPEYGGMQSGREEKVAGSVKALYAPHIDLRVGMASYVPAFRLLAELRPQRVVLLATSHYSGSYYPLYDGKPFIVTRKSFETPMGTIPADIETIRLLEEHAEATGCSFSDRAHRNEHSIELHLIFLQYLWSHSFDIVPLLVGSLEDLYYMEDGDTGKKVEAMASFLRNRFADDPDTLFVISGDLSHVGMKFGDQVPASELFSDIRTFDHKFLDHSAAASSSELLRHMKKDHDPYRICGFPPLYTALKSLRNVKGEITSYELWDERDRESAVTFGSVLFRELPR
jgi:MEMO1 family protein